MVLDPIPQSLPVHFFGSRPQPPTSLPHAKASIATIPYILAASSLALSFPRYIYIHIHICIYIHIHMHDKTKNTQQYANPPDPVTCLYLPSTDTVLSIHSFNKTQQYANPAHPLLLVNTFLQQSFPQKT